MILYPTETVYGLGVGVFDQEALKKLYKLKGRNESKSVNWIIRDFEDIKQYAVVGDLAAKIAEQFLPGPLTLILPLKNSVLEKYPFCNKTVGFRISSDPIAQKTVKDFMETHNMPLTSTSANISNLKTRSSVLRILEQFGNKRTIIDTVVDDGEREGMPSTVVEVKDEKLIVHRESQIPIGDIQAVV